VKHAPAEFIASSFAKLMPGKPTECRILYPRNAASG
jgi:hypothetical protein